MTRRRARGEGSIYQRSDGLWVGQYHLRNGERKVKYSRTQKVAKDWLYEIRKHDIEGTFADDKKITFGELLDRWFEDVEKPFLKPASQTTEASIIKNHIKPEIGDIRLSQISPANLQSLYSKKIKAGLSKRTVYYFLTIISQVLDQALKWGLISRNVSDIVDAPTPDKHIVEPLTQAQVKRLLNVLVGDRLYPLYLVMLGCGLRRGEALALQWDCVDFENEYILVKRSLQQIRGQGLVVSKPKSIKSHRIVAMPEFVKSALIVHKENPITQSVFVFFTSRGTPFSPRNIVRHFKTALAKAGLPTTIRLHDLRHTFVSWMLSENVPPKDVQVIAGHADFSTTMDIYAHLMPGAQKEAAKKLDKLFSL